MVYVSYVMCVALCSDLFQRLMLSIPNSHPYNKQSRLDQLKGTPEPIVGHKLQSLVGHLPPAIALQIWNNVAFKTSLSCSNLAGPQRPMR